MSEAPGLGQINGCRITPPSPYPDNLPEGPPTDHFGHLESSDAISHARMLVEAICLALASP